MNVSTFFRFLQIIFIVGGVCFQLSCSVNDVTGKKTLNFVTTAEEIEVGRRADIQIKKQYGVLLDPKLQSYVKES